MSNDLCADCARHATEGTASAHIIINLDNKMSHFETQMGELEKQGDKLETQLEDIQNELENLNQQLISLQRQMEKATSVKAQTEHQIACCTKQTCSQSARAKKLKELCEKTKNILNQ